MLRIVLALLIVAPLVGCAGQATYDVRPFYDQASKQVLCCAASIANGKDISSVNVHVQKTPDGYTLDFSETGVGATAPLNAQGTVISNVATAAGNTAAAIVKLAP